MNDLNDVGPNEPPGAPTPTRGSNEPGGSPAAPCSPRPFEMQSALERSLRAELWHPKNFLRNVDSEIKQASRREDFETAAYLKKRKVQATLDVATWESLLALYEQEFHSANASVEASPKTNDYEQPRHDRG